MRRLLIVLAVALWVGVCSAGTDTDALLEFKGGIKEDPSGRILGSWARRDAAAEPGDCPDDWYGVGCSGGRISSIALDGLGLAGAVNFSALATMDMLRNFSVSKNRLSGTLLPGLALLSRLEFVDLSTNSFYGSVPVEMAEMRNLVYLNLSMNSFGGEVPSVFGKLMHLRYLDICGNGFSGDLDGVLGQLRIPVHLDFSQNKFSGSLESISDDSSIISSVQYFNISHNALSGKLFAEDLLPLFDSLEVFDASFNQFTGNVPLFHFIVSLKILRLSRNQFSGSLPEALLKESSMVLNELDLSCNQLTGSLTSITSATLKSLNLSTNQLAGSLPSRVGSCMMVDLSNNKLSGNFSEVQSWGNYLEIVDLSSNILTGTLPIVTSRFLRLISLKASNNLLEGELPLVIGTYPELNVIDLSFNQLSGPLPPSLFTALRLTDLNLSGNSFIGHIPFPISQEEILFSSDASFIAQHPSLISVDLSNNSLSGSLPPEIVNLTELKLLNLDRNNISGQIPKEIGMLHSLLYLDLSSNHFEGNIPDQFPVSLVGFNVSYNNLSGTVPSSLMSFSDSSFHPGNSMLVFPNIPSASGPNFISKHGHHMRYLVIVGIVACVIVILVSILFYQRVMTRDATRKDTAQRNSPVSRLFGVRKSTDLPPSSTSFSQDQLLQACSVSVPLEPEDNLDARESLGPEIQELSRTAAPIDSAERSSLPEHERRSSLALVMSSPRSTDPYLSDLTSSISVHSPDRINGDLHLFDNSFVLSEEALSHAPAEIIGKSCHGMSYKATLDNDRRLTVKLLKEGITKGKKEFSREANKLGNIKHPNIVLLRGYYCGPNHERLIISDYINASSLTAHLCEFEQRNLRPLSLNQRLNIAIDVVRGLNYLHNERSIPHGNLKSTNILVQAPNLNALLTDYSLHRIMNPFGMAEQVLNAGALGYRPPEFASTSKPCPSLNSDVYAFGVILLELLSGKNAAELIPGYARMVDLTEWVRSLASEDRTYECFDRLIPEVNGENTPKVLDDLLHVALRCIRSAPERPETRTIFEDLSSISL